MNFADYLEFDDSVEHDFSASTTANLQGSYPMQKVSINVFFSLDSQFLVGDSLPQGYGKNLGIFVLYFFCCKVRAGLHPAFDGI